MRTRDYIQKMKSYIGKDISEIFSWYMCGDFPVHYQLRKANNRQVVVRCFQNRKVWDLKLKPSEFVRNLAFYQEAR